MHQHIRRTLGVVLLSALLLTSCAAPAPYAWPDAIDDVQNAHLQKLCKVWGFVKFHHPAVVNGGEADWDQALLDIFPQALEARDTGAVNALLSDWVGALGPAEVKEGVDAPPPIFPLPPEVGRWVTPLMEWIEDEDYLGEALSRQLKELKRLRIENSVTWINSQSVVTILSPASIGIEVAAMFRP